MTKRRSKLNAKWIIGYVDPLDAAHTAKLAHANVDAGRVGERVGERGVGQLKPLQEAARRQNFVERLILKSASIRMRKKIKTKRNKKK